VKRVRVAIVDDHALVLASLAKLLSGYSEIEVVGTVSDGKSAIALSKKVRPDVILLDIAMPGLDGFHAIPRIRAACSAAHVLLISMHDEPEYLQEAVNCGAQGLVSKASSPEDLIEAIMAAARGEIMKTSPPLSKREREVISLIGTGKTNEQIATILSISQKTVEHHRQQLMNKLDIHTEAGLIVHARRTAIAAS